MRKRSLLAVLLCILIPVIVFAAFEYLPSVDNRESIGNSNRTWLNGYFYALKLKYGSYFGTVSPGVLTANRTWTFPNKTGTIALTSDGDNTTTQGPRLGGTGQNSQGWTLCYPYLTSGVWSCKTVSQLLSDLGGNTTAAIRLLGLRDATQLLGNIDNQTEARRLIGATTNPTGTGYAHSTSGVLDSAAKTVAQLLSDLGGNTTEAARLLFGSDGNSSKCLKGDGTWGSC